jgi:hypothetical protein
MEGIYEPNSQFPFDKMVITSPTALSGGNYFLRFLVNQGPLYLQMPKSKTKAGVIQSGKKSICDLQFTNENEELISWMEDLEKFACKYIYEHREKWFETEMELTDIENYFASPLKTYKSGRFYLARAGIPQRLGKINLKVYDENKEQVPIEQITESTDVISIVEIQGIKCSARSFQIEMEIKQMMTIEERDLFADCLLTGTKTGTETSVVREPSPVSSPLETEFQESTDASTENVEPEPLEQLTTSLPLDENEVTVEDVEDESEAEDNSPPSPENEENIMVETTESQPGNLEEFLEETTLGKEKDLEDFEINLDADILSENDTMQLKQRKDVFYEMYREARKKAKIAKKMALDAYLEANKIKKAYELDSESESEDEMDEELSTLQGRNI